MANLKKSTVPTTTTERRVKNLNKDINGMLHILASLKRKPETETTFFSKRKCEEQLAQAYHQKLTLMFPKAEALYASCITETCSPKALALMVEYNWIETCGVARDGEKLYAL